MRLTRRRSKTRKRRGATVVEFAVVAPLMFILVFGLIEFGRYIMLQQIAITATREGARKAALGSTTSDTQVDTLVRSYLAAGGVQGSVANDTSKVAVTVTPFPDTTVDPGTPITVDLTMNFGDMSWLPGDFFGLASVDVSASTTMERE